MTFEEWFDRCDARKAMTDAGQKAVMRAVWVEAVAAERELILRVASPKPEVQSHNGDYSVGYGRGWNACCAALRKTDA